MKAIGENFGSIQMLHITEGEECRLLFLDFYRVGGSNTVFMSYNSMEQIVWFNDLLVFLLS